MKSFLAILIALAMAVPSLGAVNIVSLSRKPAAPVEVAKVEVIPAVLDKEIRKTTPAEATVRVAVSRPSGRYIENSLCSGTAICDHTVLTCAHVFWGKPGTLTVNGKPAKLIKIDHIADVALVRTQDKLQHIELAKNCPGIGAAVTSCGFDHDKAFGKYPTRISAVNKYAGYSGLCTVDLPQEGRSGGGLFNAAGELVGSVRGRVNKERDGTYASLAAIQKLIGEPCNLEQKTIEPAAYTPPAWLNSSETPNSCPNGQCGPRKAAPAAAVCQCPAGQCPCQASAAAHAAPTRKVVSYAGRSRGGFLARKPVRSFFGRIFGGRAARGARGCSNCG